MKRRKFIHTTLFSTGTVVFGKSLFASVLNDKNMKLTMIYNNISDSSDLISKWGLSMWIDYSDKAILFDTGGEEEVILNNIRQPGLDYNKLTAIIISHNHWDHINGLTAILEKTDYKLPVYVPLEDSKSIQEKHPKADIKGIDNFMELNTNTWTTGQLKGNFRNGYIYEQSLVLSLNENLFIITGCSHPGIVNIVKKAKEINPEGKIKLVAGGFHLLRHSNDEVKNISDELKALNVQNIAPSHCTGNDAINVFKQEWGENFVNLNLGDTNNI